MKSPAISNEDYSSLCPDQQDRSDTRRFHHIVLSRLKSFVRLPWRDTFQRHTDLEYGQCDVENRVVESKSSYSKTVVAIVVLAFITVMVLLLLWNYKCIMIDKVCEGNSDLLTPVFTEDSTSTNI